MIDHQNKAAPVPPAYISAEWMVRWLTDSLRIQDWNEALAQWQTSVGQEIQENVLTSKVHFRLPFIRDERTHVAIDSNTYCAKDKALFSTESLVLPDDMSMLAGVEMFGPGMHSWPEAFPTIHSLGGKRRLAQFSEAEEPSYWRCPAEIANCMDGAQYIRMILATPAFFAKGWRPAWLDEDLKTTQDLSEEVQLRLRWACIPRWLPISGWSYSQGEKAVRRMVPAGSVYFFEVIQGNPRSLAEHKWLNTVSDVDRRKIAFDKEDGFGLALWGKWEPQES
jgi:CRISPR-associated protein Cmr3